ncbi:MAG: FAD/NAD(P)-binding protein [Verrucomicrobiales bacterium]|nr:FAD/NAD(P)-binding protein [Verrucomicrobiales bacterium]
MNTLSYHIGMVGGGLEAFYCLDRLSLEIGNRSDLPVEIVIYDHSDIPVSKKLFREERVVPMVSIMQFDVWSNESRKRFPHTSLSFPHWLMKKYPESDHFEKEGVPVKLIDDYMHDSLLQVLIRFAFSQSVQILNRSVDQISVSKRAQQIVDSEGDSHIFDELLFLVDPSESSGSVLNMLSYSDDLPIISENSRIDVDRKGRPMLQDEGRATHMAILGLTPGDFEEDSTSGSSLWAVDIRNNLINWWSSLRRSESIPWEAQKPMEAATAMV